MSDPLSAPLNDTARGQPHVAVVDDDPRIRTLLEDALLDYGIRIDHCASVPELLSLLQHHSVDLILMDAAMPEISGLDGLQRLRQSAYEGVVLMVTAIDDPYLPLYYPSINLWSYLGTGLDKQWVSISVCQTGETDDFLRVGRAIRAAVEATDRKVIVIATGSMSHTFYKLKELRKHESSDPSHIFSQKARDMDHERLGWFFEGRHDLVIDTMPEFLTVRPEGMFAHYLMMAAALGERDLSARGVQYGDYENAIGTSQVHVPTAKHARNGQRLQLWQHSRGPTPQRPRAHHSPVP